MKRSRVGGVRRVLRCPKHVALHKVVVAAELVQIHVGGSDHPNMAVRETAAQGEGDLLQTPAEPLRSLRLQRHLLLEVLHKTTHTHTHTHTHIHTHTERV